MFFFTPSCLLGDRFWIGRWGLKTRGHLLVPGSFYWSLWLAAAVSADVVSLCNVIFLSVYSAWLWSFRHWEPFRKEQWACFPAMRSVYLLNPHLDRLSPHLATCRHSCCLSIYPSAPSHGARKGTWFLFHTLQGPQGTVGWKVIFYPSTARPEPYFLL